MPSWSDLYRLLDNGAQQHPLTHQSEDWTTCRMTNMWGACMSRTTAVAPRLGPIPFEDKVEEVWELNT